MSTLSVSRTYDPATLPKFCLGVAVVFVLHQMQVNAGDTGNNVFAGLGVTEEDLGITKEEFQEFEEHMSSMLYAKGYQKINTPIGAIYKPTYASKDGPGGSLI